MGRFDQIPTENKCFCLAIRPDNSASARNVIAAAKRRIVTERQLYFHIQFRRRHKDGSLVAMKYSMHRVDFYIGIYFRQNFYYTCRR